MSSVAQQIATSHFNKKTLKALAQNGISIVGVQHLPDATGSYANGETGYTLDDNGTGRLLTFLEVLALTK